MNDSVQVTWLGHACFRLTYKGWSLVTDPYADGSVDGLGPVRETAGAVYCSHSHGDHAAARNVTLTGAAAPADFSAAEAVCPHDDAGGTLRGMNTVRVFTFGSLRVAHMGDVGCVPGEDVLSLVRGCELMLLPVGGFYTVDPAAAREIVKLARPRAVVPMHYRSTEPAFGFGVLSTAEPFARYFPEEQRVSRGTELTLDDHGPCGLTILTPALCR